MVTLTINETASGPAIYLETFGCQMNELDSELVKGHLQALGYHFIDDRSAADVVLFNTCSVREQAENKVFSRVGQLRQEKQDGRTVIVGLLGCLAEREGAGLIKRIPEVDLLCGPGELDRLPLLLDNVLKGQARPSGPFSLQGRSGPFFGAFFSVLKIVVFFSNPFFPDFTGFGNPK